MLVGATGLMLGVMTDECSAAQYAVPNHYIHPVGATFVTAIAYIRPPHRKLWDSARRSCTRLQVDRMQRLAVVTALAFCPVVLLQVWNPLTSSTL